MLFVFRELSLNGVAEFATLRANVAGRWQQYALSTVDVSSTSLVSESMSSGMGVVYSPR